MSSFDDANRRFREDMAAHSKESKKRKLIVLQNADSYINWLNSPSLNSVTRSTMIPCGPRPCHEEKLILKLRQVSPDLKFTKLEASLNEEGSAVIVWLRCSGRHQRYSLSLTLLIIIEIGARVVRRERRLLFPRRCS
jgi:hypothetical protein